jgi:predicted phage-related endonuclease
MLTEKQMSERLSVIGGSDAPAVLGVCGDSKGKLYRTPEDVLHEKLGIKREEDARLKECGEWGDIMEPHIRNRFRRKNPDIKLTCPKKMFIHHMHHFMGCHLDGLLRCPVQGKGVFEAKMMRYEPKDIRNHYHYVQLQHNIAVMGVQWGVIAALFGGNEYKQFFIDRDDEFIEAMIRKEAAFWETVLNARKELAA